MVYQVCEGDTLTGSLSHPLSPAYEEEELRGLGGRQTGNLPLQPPLPQDSFVGADLQTPQHTKWTPNGMMRRS